MIEASLMLIVEILRARHSAITVPELAAMLSISTRQIYKLAASNRIPNFKIGSSVRFDPAAVQKWLEEKEVPTATLRRRPPTSVVRAVLRSPRTA
jgi:excisionase family DNA binding protein